MVREIKKGFKVKAEIPFSPDNNYVSERVVEKRISSLKEAKKIAGRLAKNGLRDSEGFYNRVDIEILHKGKVIKKIKGEGGM